MDYDDIIDGDMPSSPPSAKRRRSAIPAHSPPRTNVAVPEDQPDFDDTSICSICYNEWTTSGDHQICALPCGHLFGKSCIRRWLLTDNNNSFKRKLKSCPTCNAPAGVQEIVPLWIKNISAVDNSQVVSLQKQLAEVQAEYRKLKALVLPRASFLSMEGQARAFRVPGASSCCSASPSALHTLQAPFAVVATDVAASSSSSSSSSSSAAASNTSGHTRGILHRIDLATLRIVDTGQVHHGACRDLAFSCNQAYIASTALDKKLVITSPVGIRQVAEASLPMAGWAVCWHPSQEQTMYVGLNNGQVLEYDARRMDAPVGVVAAAEHAGPVHSIQIVNGTIHAASNFSGGKRCVGLARWQLPDDPVSTIVPLRVADPETSTVTHDFEHFAACPVTCRTPTIKSAVFGDRIAVGDHAQSRVLLWKVDPRTQSNEIVWKSEPLPDPCLFVEAFYCHGETICALTKSRLHVFRL